MEERRIIVLEEKVKVLEEKVYLMHPIFQLKLGKMLETDKAISLLFRKLHLLPPAEFRETNQEYRTHYKRIFEAIYGDFLTPDMDYRLSPSKSSTTSDTDTNNGINDKSHALQLQRPPITDTHSDNNINSNGNTNTIGNCGSQLSATNDEDEGTTVVEICGAGKILEINDRRLNDTAQYSQQSNNDCESSEEEPQSDNTESLANRMHKMERQFKKHDRLFKMLLASKNTNLHINRSTSDLNDNSTPENTNTTNSNSSINNDANNAEQGSEAVQDEENPLLDAQITQKHCLSPDVYSYIMLLQCKKECIMPAILASGSITFQMTFYGLSILDVIDTENLDFNPFGFPPDVGVAVRAVEVMALLVAVLSEEDLRTSLFQWRNGCPASFECPNTQLVSKCNWYLSLLARFVQGGVGLFVSFILIMRSNTVLDVMLNFLAVTFVANFDEKAHVLAGQGYFGHYCKAMAKKVSNTSYTKRNRRDPGERWWRNLRLPRISSILVLFFCFTGGWFYIMRKQKGGDYLPCKKIFVQFGDAVRRDLPALSGHYVYQHAKGTYQLKVVNQSSGVAIFQYCANESIWTLKYNSTNQFDSGPCQDWLVRSSSSEDIETNILAAGSNEWFVVNDQRKEIVLDHTRIFCSDCSRNQNLCRHGNCFGDTCECDAGWYGFRCDFSTPCSLLDVDMEEVSPFSDTRRWSPSFQILDAFDEGLVEVKGRPVYFSNASLNKLDDYEILFFSGRRWVMTSTSFIKDFDGMHVNKDTLIKVFQTTFDPFFSEFALSFTSESVDVDGASDLAAPIKLAWYLNTGNFLNAIEFNQEVDSFFRCSKCNVNSNPCLHQGECLDDGSCDCSSNGATGMLCQVPPVQNGFCDTFFNSPQFNFDGGDCCKATCTTSNFHCGWDENGFGSNPIGYCHCRDPRYSLCQNGAEMCWLPNSNPILGEMDLAESGRSVSISSDASILALGEPGINKVRVLESDGSGWTQLGQTLEGALGSRFGESVSLSGDGKVLAVGAPRSSITIHPGFGWPGNDPLGQIVVFKLAGTRWGSVFVTPDDINDSTTREDFLSLYHGSGILGTSLKLNRNGDVLFIGMPGMVENPSDPLTESRTSGYFTSLIWNEEQHTFVRYFIDGENLVPGMLTRVHGNHMSLSSSGNTIAVERTDDKFDKITRTQNLEPFVEIWTLTATNSSLLWHRLGDPVKGHKGIISSNGERLGLSLRISSPSLFVDDVKRAIELMKPVSIAEAPLHCQVYTWITNERTWREMGGPLEGECLDFSQDGLTLALKNDTLSVKTYHWNGSKWDYQGSVRAGDGSRAMLSGTGNGSNAVLVVSEPFDSSEGVNRGRTSVYNLHTNSPDFQELCFHQGSTIQIEIVADTNPSETYWELRDYVSKQVLQSGGFIKFETAYSKVFNETFAKPMGTSCLEFSIYDLGGNGICCNEGLGGYAVYYGGRLVVSGGQFGWSETNRFGHCPPLSCPQGQGLVSVEVTTDNFPHQTKWTITDSDSGNVVVQGLPFEEKNTVHEHELCLDSSMCYNFQLFDSGLNGLCCSHGPGEYKLSWNGKGISAGGRFKGITDFHEFGDCSTSPQEMVLSARDATLEIQMKPNQNFFAHDARWVLYQQGLGQVSDGNSSRFISVAKNECYVFKTVGTGWNGKDRIQLLLDGEKLMMPRKPFINEQVVIGSCGNVRSIFRVGEGDAITCNDDSFNYCSAPASCHVRDLNVSFHNDNSPGFAFGDGIWVASGGFEVSFNNNCTVTCFGNCRTTSYCSEDTDLFEAQTLFFSKPAEGSTTNAPWSYFGKCGKAEGTFAAAMWYTVTGTGTELTALSCPDWGFDTQISIFMRSCDSLICVAGNDNTKYNQNCESLVSWNSTLGITYYVAIYGNDMNEGDYSISMLDGLPINGYCDDAIALTIEDVHNSTPFIGSTFLALNDGMELPECLVCSGCTNSRGVWFTVQGTGSVLVVDLCDSDFVTFVAIFSGSCDQLDCVARNYEGCGRQSRVSWDTTHDTVYYILVSGVGNYVLKIMEAVPPGNDKCTDASLLTWNGTRKSHEFTGSTMNATADEYNPDYPGVWFTVHGTGSALVVDASSSGSSFLGAVAIFSGSCDELDLVAEDFFGVMWDTTPNTVYYILLMGYDSYFRGNYVLIVMEPVPPDNDKCSGANPITVSDIRNSNLFTGSTDNARADEHDLPECLDCAYCRDDPGVWFTVEGTGSALVAHESEYDAVVSIFSGACNELDCVAVREDRAIWETSYNTVYYIFVQSTFDYTLKITETVLPGNDKCRDASLLTLDDIRNSNEFMGSTENATIDKYDLPECLECDHDGCISTKGVWYTVEGTGTPLVAEVCDSDYHAHVSIFSGACNELVCLAEQEAGGCDVYDPHQRRVIWDTTNSTVYYILVHSNHYSEFGNYTLKVMEHSIE